MIDSKDILKIASLSRLEVRSEDLEKMTGQMNQILGFIDKLGQLDTSNITPTSHAVQTGNAFREDVVVESQVRDKLFEVAPAHEGNFFRVPKVI